MTKNNDTMVNDNRKPYRHLRRGAFRLFPLLFACSLLFSPAAFAQDERVTLPAREITRSAAFDEIGKQTDYKVAVNVQNIDWEKRVTLPAVGLTVRGLLDAVLAGSGCRWEVVGKHILVLRDNTPVAEGDVYSAMYRDALPDDMKVVPDPYGSRRITGEEIARIRNGRWRSDDKAPDSVALAIINFRVNRTTLEKDYMDNARTLDMIHRTFSDKELLTAMDFITVTAAASPEGNTAANEKLAANRALAVKSYIMWRYPFMNRDNIFTFSIGEDWTGLRRMVEQDMDTPYRAEVLGVLDSDGDSQLKRSMLRGVGGGAAYRYIAANMLPKLRGAAACMIYYKEEPQTVTVVDTVRTHTHTHDVDTVYIDRVVEKERIVTVQAEEAPARKTYYMSVKTNLLYDLALLPDLAFEFSLPRRWSIEVGGQWSWWNTRDPKHFYHRIQFAGLEARKWLGRADRTPLTGHFLGVYGMGGTYDLKFGDEGVLSDRSWSAGLTYGYAHPIGRRLNLEYSLGVGYLGGEYKRYTWYSPHQCYPWEGTFDRSYFGLTKAEVSLVWLIGSGKNPERKR
jgi:hypothetical protein